MWTTIVNGRRWLALTAPTMITAASQFQRVSWLRSALRRTARQAPGCEAGSRPIRQVCGLWLRLACNGFYLTRIRTVIGCRSSFFWTSCARVCSIALESVPRTISVVVAARVSLPQLAFLIVTLGRQSAEPWICLGRYIRKHNHNAPLLCRGTRWVLMHDMPPSRAGRITRQHYYSLIWARDENWCTELKFRLVGGSSRFPMVWNLAPSYSVIASLRFSAGRSAN